MVAMSSSTRLALFLLLAIPIWAGPAILNTAKEGPAGDLFQLRARVSEEEAAQKAAAPRIARQPGTPNSILAAAQQNFVPIPPNSLSTCKNCSTKGYDQVQITPDVWAITDGTYWAMAVVSNPTQGYYRAGTKSVRTLAVVDAPPTMTNFVDAIKEILVWTGATTVTDFVLSHHHTDHIGGGDAVVSQWPKARVIAQESVKTILTDGRSLVGRPIPTVTFKKEFKLANYGLELTYPGQTHSTGNIFVYHPKSKTLLFIDVVFPGWVPFKNFAVSESIPGFVHGFALVLGFDFNTIIAGHVTKMGSRDDVLQGQQYVNDVMSAATQALATIDWNQVGAQLGVNDPTNPNYQNSWLWFQTYLDECATFCYNQVAPKWIGVIAAVDVWTYAHCDTAVESVRID